MKKRIISLLMCLVMTFSLLPTAAWAELAPAQGEEQPSARTETAQAAAAAPQSGESTVAVQAGTAVAKIGDTEYATLEAAFKAAIPMGHPIIKLLQNVTLSSNSSGYGIYVEGTSVTLDLNGYTISQEKSVVGSQECGVFYVSDYSLTITDSSANGNGAIEQPNRGTAVYADNGNGQVIVEKGKIRATAVEENSAANTPNCAVFVRGGSAIINGGTLEGKVKGIVVSDGNLTVTGGTIYGETSNALLVNVGNVNLSGGTFDTNEPDNHSIWAQNGNVKGLLASSTLTYMTDAGEESPVSADEKGVKGKTTVKVAPERVPYIDNNGEQSRTDCAEIITADTVSLSDGWYVVKESAEVGTLDITGSNVNLILGDGATLTVKNQITGNTNKSLLKVYLQGGGTGVLVAEQGHDAETLNIGRQGTPMKMANNKGDVADARYYYTISKCDHSKATDCQSDAIYHDGQCSYCGTRVYGQHTFDTWTYKDETTHTSTCTVCGYEAKKEHEIRYINNSDGLTCKRYCLNECGLATVDVEHVFDKEKCVNCRTSAVASVTAKDSTASNYYTTLQGAFDNAQDDAVITLLTDVELAKTLSIVSDDSNHYANNFTLDLNGKKISCSADDTTTVFTSTTLTICDSSTEKTGEIKQNVVYAVQVGSNGTLTITGGKFGKVYAIEDWTEISGGEFSAIGAYGRGGGSAKLHTLLKNGFAFQNSAGEIVNGYEKTNATDVTVVPHRHSGVTCACGYTCDHSAGMDTTTGNCSTCGKLLAQASVTAGESTIYYTDLKNAITAAAAAVGSTVTLLQDITLANDDCIDINNNDSFTTTVQFTIDWNGHTLSGNYYSGLLTIADAANVTLKDSVGTGGVTATSGIAVMLSVDGFGSATIEGGTYSPQVRMDRYCQSKVQISGGVFQNPEGAGQRFALYNYNGSLAAMLTEGYTFSYDEAGTKLVDVYNSDYVGDHATVYVVKHTHKFNADTGKCACGKPCQHQLGADGKCTSCGATFVAQVNDTYYTTVTAALDAANNGATVTLLTNAVTENVTFDGGGKSVTLAMDGKTLTAPNNDNSALTVSSGTLTITGAATISNPETSDPYNQNLKPAITLSGGKLVFTDKLTAQGGVFNNPGNATAQEFAVNATGGELDFRGDLDLEGGLKITGSATLTNKLTKGTFRIAYSRSTSLSVEGAKNYRYLHELLEDGYAYVDKDNPSIFRCVHSFTSWSGSVTIVPHTHTWEPGSGDNYQCKDCKKSCAHEGGYKTGKCEVCGKPCLHASTKQNTDYKYYCDDCGQEMVARIVIGQFKWSHFPNLTDALKAAENGQTVLLLVDTALTKDAYLYKEDAATADDMVVTLDLNGHNVTQSGWASVLLGEGACNTSTGTAPKGPFKLVVRGSGNFEPNIRVTVKAALDLSGWTGGTIGYVELSDDRNVDDDLRKQTSFIVGKDAGTIGQLWLGNWQLGPEDTANAVNLSGGSYSTIQISGHNSNLISLGDLLASGYAFKVAGSDDKYVPYNKKLTTESDSMGNINNLTVVPCPHASITNGTCDYCNKTGIVAAVNDDLYENFADAQSAWLADGGTLKLYKSITATTDITNKTWAGTSDKTYTLDLNGYQITAPGDDSGSTALPYQITVTSMDLTVKDTSEKADGQLDNLLLSKGSTLTLQSGWLGALTVPKGNNIKVQLKGGGLKYSDIKVPLPYVLPDGYDLLGAADLSGTNAWSENDYTVQKAPAVFGGGKEGTMSLGKNKLPFAPTITMNDGATEPAKITVAWYLWDSSKSTTKNLANGTMIKSGSTWTYDSSTEAASHQAYDGMNIGDEYKVFAVVEAKDSTANRLWRAALTGYQLTIGKANLADAVVTLDNKGKYQDESGNMLFQPKGSDDKTGQELTQKVTVTLYDQPLTEGTDYIVSGNKKSDAGDYTLTVTAAADSTLYTGSTTKGWRIAPLPLSCAYVQLVKPYDGTAAVKVDDATVVRVDAESGMNSFSRIGGLVKGEDYELSDISTDYPSADQGQYGNMHATVTLKNPNYVFSNGTNVYQWNITSPSNDCRIDCATAPEDVNTTLTVTNNHAATYTLDVSKLLPELSVGCTYGDTSYLLSENGTSLVQLNGQYYDEGKASIDENGLLTLPIKAVNSDVEGSIGTVNVKVVSHNYYSFDITINVVTENKTHPTGAPTLDKTAITYGDAIGSINLSGSMKDGTNDVPGTFTWDAPNTIPDAGTYQAAWTFKPNNTKDYHMATGTATITVNKADVDITKVPAANKLTYTGQPQALVTAGTVSGGILQYSLTESGPYTENVPTATNAGEYTVWYKVEGDSNHNSTDPVQIQVTIARADVTLTTAPTAADLTYNGQSQALVTAGAVSGGILQYSLDQNGTYTENVPTATNAGAYTVWYKVEGDSNHNDVPAASIAARIKAKDISQARITLKDVLTYNGKAQLPEIKSVVVDGMTLAEGTDYTVVFKNAVQAGDYPLTLTGKGNFTGTADQNTFTIGKATLTVEPIHVSITNNHAATYTVDLTAALTAALPQGCRLGAVSYGAVTITGDTHSYCDSSKAAVSQGILTLAINQVDSTVEGPAATVTVTATTGNYQDITLTVVLDAVNKTVPTGTPNLSKTTLAYNETLSAIRLSGTMRDGSTVVRGTFAWTEPDLRPASGTYIATWVFTPEDGSKYAPATGTVNITVTPPPAAVPVYTVSGTVTEYSVTDPTHKQSIQGAVVTIRKGMTILNGQRLTDEQGNFSLAGVVAGVYNVVVEYQGKTVTTKVELTQDITGLAISIPREDVNSELAVGTGLTRDTVVGGLDEEANRQFTADGNKNPDGASVSVGMTIQEKPADAADEAQKAIREKAAGKSLDFMDLNLLLTKNGSQSPLTETGTVLEIIISYDTSRQGITVVRHHDDAAEVFSQLKELPGSRTDATFFVDTEKQCIHIFASRFSTYAIGYTPVSSSGSSGSGSSTAKDDVTSADTFDSGVALYAALALTSLSGLKALRRKREED